jgi:nucleoside-diphosphate-sugar epimerase
MINTDGSSFLRNHVVFIALSLTLTFPCHNFAMPAVNPGSRILVSGANGYIAVWIVRVLLERGFSVRGTVRSESKAGYLRKMFSSYGDKHEVVVVEDITKVCTFQLSWLHYNSHRCIRQEGAFDEVVKGVDAIAHTASPFHLKADDTDGRSVIADIIHMYLTMNCIYHQNLLHPLLTVH